MKTCTKCGIEKALTEFHKQKLGKFGVRAICIACVRKYAHENRERISAYYKDYCTKNADAIKEKNQAYYLENKERIDSANRMWREANPEKVVQGRHEHYLRNKNRVAIQAKEWRTKNADRVRESREKYIKLNKEKIQEYSRNYYLENRDTALRQGSMRYALKGDLIRRRHSEWKRANLDKIREYNNRRRAMLVAAEGSHTADDALEILAAQQYKCANTLCAADLRVTKRHLDHKVPLVRGGSNGRENLQWLCASCNLSKWAMTDEEWRQKLGLSVAA
ncbi:HNH endonuclease signature motif containing protein [Burkholderia sp. BCC0405]|uniref:HNH endonuclease n=1 Tax=Burkholderia sp. BCC0405 TaxID=2676298 RepID=UPI00158A948E|nr:HNH endonuclease signature motif containing protein [Burkholderia sp. BCC0405]